MDVRVDHKESWAPENWCFWTVVLEKTLESRLDCKEIQPVNPKRKSTLNIHWKDWCWSWNSNTLATWCEEPTHWERPCCWERLKAGEKGTTEDEMVGRNHRFNGHEFEQTLADGEGQGSLVCCSHRVPKSWTWLSDWTITTGQYTIISRYLIKIFPSPMPICFPSFLSAISILLKLSQGLWPLRWIAKFLTQS